MLTTNLNKGENERVGLSLVLSNQISIKLITTRLG